jgi:hypothetical protein
MASSLSHYVVFLCYAIITVHCQLDSEKMGENQLDTDFLDSVPEPNQFHPNQAEEETLYSDYLAEMNPVDSGSEKEQLSNNYPGAELVPQPDQVNAEGEEALEALQLACKYTCPSGKSPQKHPSYSPAKNGCGPQGTDIFNGAVRKTCSYIIECCDQHDICYGTYGESQSACDSRFHTCNQRTPPKMNIFNIALCKAKGGLMTAAVKALGCSFFKNAQRPATICV